MCVRRPWYAGQDTDKSKHNIGPGFRVEHASILHYAKVTAAFGQDLPRDPMWGTVGSGLTPGSPPDGRTPEIPDPDPENPEKPENPFPARFALLRPNQGTYRHGRGIHGSGLT